MGKKGPDFDPDTQRFIDYQEHRYDPGYWTTQWYARGRTHPETEAYRKAKLGSFYKTLLIFAFIGFPLFQVVLYLREFIPHWRIVATVVLVGSFVTIFTLISRSNRSRLAAKKFRSSARLKR